MTDEQKPKMVVNTELAKPLHYQQLERSLDMQPFLSCVENMFQAHYCYDEGTSDSDSENDVTSERRGGGLSCNGVTTSKQGPVSSRKGFTTTQDQAQQDRRSDRMRLYNFAHIKEDRSWLQHVLVSDSSDHSEETPEVTEESLQEMLRLHEYKKKCRKLFYSNPDNHQYQYYGSSLLSNYDKFQEHQASIVGNKRKRKQYKLKKNKKIKHEKQHDGKEKIQCKEEVMDNLMSARDENQDMKPHRMRKKDLMSRNPEVLTFRRRKIWTIMSKKEVMKLQRSKFANHRETMTSAKRVATYCMRNCRQKAMQSQKNMKETMWRAKRLSREMQVYWKRYDRVERETRKRMEKEAEEQRKMDVELMEAKRQQRKLNFLITQTELYAHFMSRKLGGVTAEEQLRILSQLEEENNPRLSYMDQYNSDEMKQRVKRNVTNAVQKEQMRSCQYGSLDVEMSEPAQPGEERPQPAIFNGLLKHYQLKGMNWLANLYDQGINGILADEMGLGKTVQSIAFLCHIAEKYSVWGPFLIISPASTLHNWQQEMARFVPDFKVVPYWGNPQERKILRQFWDQKDLHTQDASFHVVITSYQLVITDFKYFNRIKWQYLILDEAQAIKSASSVRWKLLLGFSCRNRLLLSGTPIQNSMAELWALLHFIMPTMFDSHDEFNEWFSKDIESHAENKTGIDEKHLSRLHLILKPFMLRRIKKDVENELSDKIEIMVYCPLTTRQKILYSALKKKIRIEDLLHTSSAYQSSQSITTSLMNLVMQFRKVCNHPELFERREAKSPYFMRLLEYTMARLVFDDGILQQATPSQRHLLCNQLSVFAVEYIHRSLFPTDWPTAINSRSSFSFLRLVGVSPQEVYRITIGGLLHRWLDIVRLEEEHKRRSAGAVWWGKPWPSLHVPSPMLSMPLKFTSYSSLHCVFSHTDITIHHVPESLEHRILRSRKAQMIKEIPVSAHLVEESEVASPIKPIISILPEFKHIPRPPRILHCHPTILPPFVSNTHHKVECRSRELYCSNRRAAWHWLRHSQCTNAEGYASVWYGSPKSAQLCETAAQHFTLPPSGGITALTPPFGWSNIIIPDKHTLVTDAGKLNVLDSLLKNLKEQGHRVLIYSQMTRMIDLLEEYMWFRKHTYKRLDGSSKISARRDMVADFQSRADIFVFLLSTRAGGLGINLTAADTVIFYDSDWNPTVDQQAMDRAHRLGQTKQVTVYRLICKGTIEQRILQRAREKSEIQRMVISGGNFKPDTLKPYEVVSLLLDDEELEQKYQQKQAERRQLEESRADNYKDKERKRKKNIGYFKEPLKQIKLEDPSEEAMFTIDSGPASPAFSDVSAAPSQVQFSDSSTFLDETSSDALIVDVDKSSIRSSTPKDVRRRGSRGPRGRPRARRGGLGRAPSSSVSTLTLPGGLPVAPMGIGRLGRGMGGPKRGPGRPRLKTSGPSNQGTRGRLRGKAQRPTAPSPMPTEPIKPFGYYTQDLELIPMDTDIT